MTQAIIHQHIEASREAGTLAAVERIADELAVALKADPDRVRAILFRDRDEANEIGRRRRHIDFEIWAERLDERTTEALDALSRPVEDHRGRGGIHMNQTIPDRWQDCRVASALRPFALEQFVHWLRRVLLTAEQTARTVWYFVAGVPG
jgi:hypothetical protein